MPSLRLSLTALMLLAALAAACSRKDDGRAGSDGPSSSGTTVPLPGGGSGRAFGPASERGVIVLADGDQTVGWSALAEEMGRTGYRVVILPGSAADGAAEARAVAELLARQGTSRIVFVGDGRSSGAALRAAADGASGVAVLNPVDQPDPLPATGVPPVALLAMASLTNGASSATAQRIYQAAQEPRQLALYPAREPVPQSFDGDSNQLRAAFLDFLRLAFQPLSA